ncbi:hypothetical protein FOQG_16345 [Fusarium oxysporum f. sp. raphani 54005]|jgi:hypothetical protein|uniref:Uncharacterized protein n=3 Tax=Fusarium oxysporum species complex TaxID=171631 RepID=X0BKJ2_FUSOX|nr:uncharacterized protein FOIG_16712 [Fusarium odoratissimum NRRL 54006]EXK78999.1 hypothetical protein FOQG_16345 [Fusarium oxysporum f. sp. raphani 54005]EXL40747.1 hypothetical protein FOCG_16691 [Fusarium oxysporum f. sp. radicis-lycopersici 26381]EXL90012.1 hypothetical protein FOIG_16712 [Fusarium odoratissimum NRRL 54006]TXB97269.1 hypothetical protein FocTR4_00012141 [Fusarium oxysporum f. sp. cubense]
MLDGDNDDNDDIAEQCNASGNQFISTPPGYSISQDLAQKREERLIELWVPGR